MGEQLRAMFQRFDVSNTGFLDRKEFKDAFKDMEFFGHRPSDRELEQMFAQYDTRGDNKLSFDEFAIFMLKRAQL
eukprot:NODE_4689_length_338_cov_308.553633_g4082_i0.p1 GENE.NODE_4689_length_338_cov_308.553633_g4082_i0~~NODE_4689_length_338_cov_308.553633_g4082_i0.p1  ORF type:complete len:84 (-),score=23.03 NODE_4689_length_338_cov_308.553633_g4082_i0:85-309(-)